MRKWVVEDWEFELTAIEAFDRSFATKKRRQSPNVIKLRRYWN